MRDLLLEIGTEEIPARFLRKAAQDLTAAVVALLDEAQLSFASVTADAAPRQLTLFGHGLQDVQADRRETVTGPPVRIAYDADGNPTKALQGFLRKNPAIKADQLTTITEKKGDVVAAEIFIAGRQTINLLREALPTILAKLYFPKPMRWGSCKQSFVRPVRSIVALLGGEIVPFAFAGVAAGKQSFGHRFHGSGAFDVSGIEDYLSQKSAAGILCLRETRLQSIRDQIEAHLADVAGHLVADEGLLQEWADLVETPHVVLGSFPDQFLAIPREVLITSMREHQKSFALEDSAGKMMPYFLAIASVTADRKGLIRKGNEWVLNARLWDAKFFWDADRKKDFESFMVKLDELMFIKEIGSYRGKAERMAQLVGSMAKALQLDENEREASLKAARYAKADLVSELVFEFAELQGIAGGLLLQAQGEPEAVWRGVYDHYLPVSLDDALPQTTSGALVSIADKLDTLVGCFAVGLIPTGSKDPYALRRAAQGLVRTLIGKTLPLSLDALLQAALDNYRGVVTVADDLHATLRDFVLDRVRYILKRDGFDHDVINAVLATDTDRVDQTALRAAAVAEQQHKDHFRSLALNLKRMNNVIADEQDKLGDFDASLLSEAPEVALWDAVVAYCTVISKAVAERRYTDAMNTMSELAEPIEVYFGTDGVYINTEDERIRLNRKAMIALVRDLFGLVADISHLAPKG